ncbi:hypothetical protein ACFL1V_07545 [Pseudomonadota bacterium]
MIKGMIFFTFVFFLTACNAATRWFWSRYKQHPFNKSDAEWRSFAASSCQGEGTFNARHGISSKMGHSMKTMSLVLAAFLVSVRPPFYLMECLP